MSYENFTEDEKSSLLYTPSPSEKKKIDYIKQEIENIETSTSEIRKTIKKCRQNYRCEYEKKYTKNAREKFFAPLTREFCNAVAPKFKILQEALVANPTEENDTLKAKIFEFMLKWQTKKMRFFERLNTEGKREMAVDGTLVAKICWDFETKEEVVEEKTGNSPLDKIKEFLGKGIKKTIKSKVVEDKPSIEFIDLLDCYIDPMAKSIQDAPFFAIRYLENIDDLKENKLYKNTQFVKGETTIDEGTNDSTATQKYDVGATQESQIEKAEVFECWTDENVITIAGRENPVIIREQKNPFAHGKKPFEECWYIKTGRRWYGVGVAELLLQLQRLLNEWGNQKIENREILLNKMFMVKRGSIKDVRQLVSRPAGFIEVDDLGSIKPLEFSDITSKAFEEEQSIYSWAQRITNSWSMLSGGAEGGSGTATESMIRSRGSEGYFGDIAMNLKDFVIRVVSQLAQLDQQFLDEEATIRIMGDSQEFAPLDDAMSIPEGVREDMGQFRFIHLDDYDLIKGNYDFDIDIDNSQITDRAVKVKQLIEYSQWAGSNPVIAQKINWTALAKEVLSLQGINPEKIFSKEKGTEEMPQGGSPEEMSGLPPGVPNEAMINAGAMLPQMPRL